MKYASINGLTVGVVYITKPIGATTIEIPDDVFSQFTQNIDGTFTAPTSPPSARRDTGSAREFMDLFTNDEKIAIVTLSMSSATIKLWYDEALAGHVWLGHANVNAGLLALVALEAITSERKAIILATDFDT